MTTLGLIIVNRRFFPIELCERGRKTIIDVLKKEGCDVIALSTVETPEGSIKNYEEAKKNAALFRAHRDEIDGILVTLPNFGDERSVANAIKFSGLNVPVLVHAFPDEIEKMDMPHRRDSFCGKISVCNNLKQYGIPFTLTRQHTVNPESESFREDLRNFCATCRIVKGLRSARFGQIGVRPAAFNTVRYSEKLLEKAGISVETLDLSEIFDQANNLSSDDLKVNAKLGEIRNYIKTEGIPAEALQKMARFAIVIDSFIEENELAGTSIQCWISMEKYFGIVPCTIMSMLSNSIKPSACEADTTGLIGMYAMVLASGKPSALLDWNNNFGNDPDLGVVFHCSNLPKDIFEGEIRMDYQEKMAGDMGKENTYGTISGKIKSGSFTYCGISTDDEKGTIKAYIGEGESTTNTLNTFGGYGVFRVPNLQKLMHYVCRNGFEHHVAMNPARLANALNEAFSTYLGWDIYYHNNK